MKRLLRWLYQACFGKVEIDNNHVENAIRPSTIGKKHWLFIGPENSGQTSTILYRITESAKHHNLEPYNYIFHLLQELPKATNFQIPRFPPKAIAKK
ncbi:IS66 family transposase [Rubellicoccus peritrichatus]|uniref:IS66 family transposase n=1 Tax=Rubellicoccus peritrichatus TaxID=3080537 RepID=UPI0031F303AD